MMSQSLLINQRITDRQAHICLADGQKKKNRSGSLFITSHHLKRKKISFQFNNIPSRKVTATSRGDNKDWWFYADASALPFHLNSYGSLLQVQLNNGVSVCAACLWLIGGSQVH